MNNLPTRLNVPPRRLLVDDIETRLRDGPRGGDIAGEVSRDGRRFNGKFSRRSRDPLEIGDDPIARASSEPERVHRMYTALTACYHVLPRSPDHARSSRATAMVLVKYPVLFLCAHHLSVPSDGRGWLTPALRVIGLSSPRVVEMSRGAPDLGAPDPAIARLPPTRLEPQGVRGRHGGDPPLRVIRGSEPGTIMTTSSVLGFSAHRDRTAPSSSPPGSRGARA